MPEEGRAAAEGVSWLACRPCHCMDQQYEEDWGYQEGMKRYEEVLLAPLELIAFWSRRRTLSCLRRSGTVPVQSFSLAAHG